MRPVLMVPGLPAVGREPGALSHLRREQRLHGGATTPRLPSEDEQPGLCCAAGRPCPQPALPQRPGDTRWPRHPSPAPAAASHVPPAPADLLPPNLRILLSCWSAPSGSALVPRTPGPAGRGQSGRGARGPHPLALSLPPLSPRAAWPSPASWLQLSACSELTPPSQAPRDTWPPSSWFCVARCLSRLSPLHSVLSLGAWAAICPSRSWHVILDPPSGSASTHRQPRSCLSHLPSASRARRLDNLGSACDLAVTLPPRCQRDWYKVLGAVRGYGTSSGPPASFQGLRKTPSAPGPHPITYLPFKASRVVCRLLSPGEPSPQVCSLELCADVRRPPPKLLAPSCLCVCVSAPQASQGSVWSMPPASRVAAGGPLGEGGAGCVEPAGVAGLWGAAALTSCCGGGSRRRRCSSSGRSGCSAGTNAGTGSGGAARGHPAASLRQPPWLPCASGASHTPTSGPPLRLSLTPRREISRSQEAGGRRWTVSFRAVAIWGRGQRGGALRGTEAPPPLLEHSGHIRRSLARVLERATGVMAVPGPQDQPATSRHSGCFSSLPQPGPQPPRPHLLAARPPVS